MCFCGWGESAAGVLLGVLWTYNAQESATGESWHSGASYWADWKEPHCRCGYVFPTKGPSFWSAREGNGMRPLVLFVPVWVLSVPSVLICVPNHVYVYCATCTGLPMGNTLSLATDWTRGHGAMAASALSAYWIQQPLTLLLPILYYFCISTCSFHSPVLKKLDLSINVLQELLQLLHLNTKHFSVTMGYFFFRNYRKV